MAVRTAGIDPCVEEKSVSEHEALIEHTEIRLRRESNRVPS